MSNGLGSIGDGESDLGIVPGLRSAIEPAQGTAGGPSGGLPFDVVLRGYDRRQVDARLTELQDRLAELTDALASARRSEESARKAAERARAELERGRPSFDALGERVVGMLRLAEAEADEQRAAGQRDAAKLREAGERDAEEIRRGAERAVEALQRRWGDVLAQVATARESLDTILTASRTIDITEPITTTPKGGNATTPGAAQSPVTVRRPQP